ncbi:hypothetical protein DAPPUDRAFT_309814 [Daphnia pulex]|uniref:Uncharacterized protein n=1 Tax=Daphnia pulex TaxID=6669 RepID=E9FQW2_DAPPU|nr:hypothetical protein DAPPUDRAFT_309814 [Daphnia pulex]|eukprot:EFX90301.1 hypothetical protein DAPPUDRAFT_309814 [Daphnia pulex]
MKLNGFIEDFSWNSKCHCNQWLRITSKHKDGDNKHNEGMWDQHLSLFLDGLLLRAIIPTSNYSLTLKNNHTITLTYTGTPIWDTDMNDNSSKEGEIQKANRSEHNI